MTRRSGHQRNATTASPPRRVPNLLLRRVHDPPIRSGPRSDLRITLTAPTHDVRRGRNPPCSKGTARSQPPNRTRSSYLHRVTSRPPYGIITSSGILYRVEAPSPARPLRTGVVPVFALIEVSVRSWTILPQAWWLNRTESGAFMASELHVEPSAACGRIGLPHGFLFFL
jgi:hypothetical protein